MHHSDTFAVDHSDDSDAKFEPNVQNLVVLHADRAFEYIAQRAGKVLRPNLVNLEPQISFLHRNYH